MMAETQVRDGYKMTELGEIPVEWEVVGFFDYIDQVLDFRGRTPQKLGMNWGNGTIRALSANNVKMGYIDFEKECHVASLDLYEKWMTKGDLRKNDILFTMEAPLGNVAKVPDDNLYILSQRVVAFKLNNKLYSDYFKYYLMSDDFHLNLKKQATGTTAQGISQKNLGQLFVLVPSFPEQQKIAEILSTVDEQIENTKQLIEKTRELKKGLMQQLLTKGIGHTEFKETELGEIPVEWEVFSFQNLLDQCILDSIQDGNHGEKHPRSSDYVDKKEMNAIPFIMASDINNGSIDYSNCKYINLDQAKGLRIGHSHPEDVLFTHKGSVGRTALVDDKYELIMLTPQVTAYRIRLKNSLLKEYLKYYLESDTYKRVINKISSQSTRDYIGISTQKKQLIIFPSFPEQQKIASILSSVDEQIESYEAEKEKYVELKKGLMQQLLTGKMRVKI